VRCSNIGAASVELHQFHPDPRDMGESPQKTGIMFPELITPARSPLYFDGEAKVFTEEVDPFFDRRVGEKLSVARKCFVYTDYPRIENGTAPIITASHPVEANTSRTFSAVIMSPLTMTGALLTAFLIFGSTNSRPRLCVPGRASCSGR